MLELSCLAEEGDLIRYIFYVLCVGRAGTSNNPHQRALACAQAQAGPCEVMIIVEKGQI